MSQYSQVIQVAAYPSNSFLIVGKRIVAVDVGTPAVAGKCLDIVMKTLHRHVSDIEWIVATHYHVDHVGGIEELLRFTSAKVLLPEGIRGHIERDEPLVFPGGRRWLNILTNQLELGSMRPSREDLEGLSRTSRIGLPGGLNRKAPFDVEGYLEDGQELPGGNGFRAIATPGHTPCSVCFHEPESGTLITGDTIIGGITGPLMNSFVPDTAQILSSIDKLKQFGIGRILPGHGKTCKGATVMEGISESLAPAGLASIPFHLMRRIRHARQEPTVDSW